METARQTDRQSERMDWTLNTMAKHIAAALKPIVTIEVQFGPIQNEVNRDDFRINPVFAVSACLGPSLRHA